MENDLREFRERLSRVERDLRAMRRTGHAVSLFLLGGLAGAVLLAAVAPGAPTSSPRGRAVAQSPIPHFIVSDGLGDRRFEVADSDQGTQAILLRAEGTQPSAGLLWNPRWGGGLSISSGPAASGPLFEGSVASWLGSDEAGGRLELFRPRNPPHERHDNHDAAVTLSAAPNGGELEIYDSADRRAFRAP